MRRIHLQGVGRPCWCLAVRLLPDTFLRLHLSLWSVSKNPQSRTENYRKEH
nr:MAG TPA: hypothetical protein [Caudoviricetes sp.]